ncbi:MAG: AAA family ATPase, partial [Synergistaceae bacterium]|nr:AAA family ATPase [Synergistaceae bacterium]
MQKIFKVSEAYSGDAMKGLARIHPDDMKELNLSEGDLIEITGKKTTSVRIRAGDLETGRDIIQIDGLIRENAGTSLDEKINLESSITYHFAGSATLQPLGDVKLSDRENDQNYILSMLEGQAVR